MKILITGVAGLLGSRLADYIIAKYPQHTVIGIDDLSGGFMENIHKKVVFYKINLVDGDIDYVFKQHQPDYVYHMAAYAAVGLSPFIRAFNYQNNLVATSRVVNSCIKYNVKRLVFTSSMDVYGRGQAPFTEKDTPQPIDPYGIAKYACELDIMVAGEQHGLDWCIIRPHNVYGIKQNIWDKYRNVLGIWMYQYMNNEPMTIFGSGEQTRSFSYIDDCLNGLWKSATQSNCSKEIINLGGTKFHTINEANEMFRDIIGGGEVIYVEGRHEVKYAYPTWEKSVELLGYADRTTLYRGLSNMWEWAKTQPNRKRYEWPNYELDNGIYSYWKKH